MIDTLPVKYSAVRLALRDARTYDEVKGIRDWAVATTMYGKLAKDTQLIEDATDIKLRAERRAAQMIAEARESGELARQGQPKKNGDRPVTLIDIGISKKDSSRWGKLGKMSDGDFEKHLEQKKKVVNDAVNKALNVHFSSDSSEWYTPEHIIDLVRKVLKEIDLDPCSNAAKSVPAALHYTKEDDGLSHEHEWRGRIYMNPPYGDEISDWTEKLRSEYERGSVTEAIALVPARTDTVWFRPFEHAVFISGRLKFSNSKDSAPFPSAVLYLGKRWEVFKSVFKEVGEPWKKD